MVGKEDGCEWSKKLEFLTIDISATEWDICTILIRMKNELHEYRCPKCFSIELLKESTFNMRRYRNSNCRVCNRKRLKENNPFAGKTHSKETKDLLAKKAASRELTGEHKAKITAVLRKINFKTPLYEHWLLKHGKEIADQKLADMKVKHSRNSSGKNNGMFGKPSPKGSGAGISGWYNDWFFRSLRELTYVLTVLEPNGDKWICAEKKNCGIKYEFNNQSKTYFPDFIVNDSKIVEIKPERLQKIAINLAKKEAAEKYCVDNHLEYVIMDVKPIKKQQLIELIDNGLVVLTKKSQEKAKLK